jgi:hypothetical protein
LIIIRAFVPLFYHQENLYASAAFKEEGGNELEVGSGHHPISSSDCSSQMVERTPQPVLGAVLLMCLFLIGHPGPSYVAY